MKLITEVGTDGSHYVYDVSDPEHVLRGTFLLAQDADKFRASFQGEIDDDDYEKAEQDIRAEVHRARVTLGFGPMNNAHEGLAIIMEEFDELNAHVWTSQKKRDIAAMRAEAIQVAAMALCFAAEVCNEETGRK